MSTETPTPTPTAPVPTPTPPPAPAAPPATPAQEVDWKAEARKHEARWKEYKPAADELAALKAAQMTETEKATARTAELEAKVKGFESAAQVTAWKAEVAEATGVPAAALSGSTLEALQAHAAILKPLITAVPPQRGPLVPTEGTRSGPPAVTQLNRDDLKGMTSEQINAAKTEGRLNDVLGIKS